MRAWSSHILCLSTNRETWFLACLLTVFHQIQVKFDGNHLHWVFESSVDTVSSDQACWQVMADAAALFWLAAAGSWLVTPTMAVSGCPSNVEPIHLFACLLMCCM